VRRAAALALLAVLLVSCRERGLQVIPESELPADVYGSPPAVPTERIPEKGTVYLVREGHLAPVERPLPQAARTVPEALLLALLQAATVTGFRTEVPSETDVNDVEVEQGIATVDVSEEFEQGGTGRSLALRVAQVVFTLTEDDRVSGVVFSIGGRTAAVTSARGEVLDRFVTRDDYSDFMPPAEGEEDEEDETV
jgi:spore germination protein GerM